MGTSYTRSTKTGPSQRIIQRTSAAGKMTTTKVERIKLGNGVNLETRVTGGFKAPKAQRMTSSKGSNSRSSKSMSSTGDGGTMLIIGLFVAIIAGVGYLFSKAFGWIFGSIMDPERSEPEPPEPE